MFVIQTIESCSEALPVTVHTHHLSIGITLGASLQASLRGPVYNAKEGVKALEMHLTRCKHAVFLILQG